MVGLLLLAVGLLVHVSGVMRTHRMTHEERTRSGTLVAARELMERLWADEDTAGLYLRLQGHALAARQSGALGPDQVRLRDGRRAFLPTTYFPDYKGSHAGATHVLFDVPMGTPLDPDDPRSFVLREDLASQRFELPADLNGDGTIDADPRDDDYRVLPVEMVLRWQPDGESPRELRMVLWVRCER